MGVLEGLLEATFDQKRRSHFHIGNYMFCESNSFLVIQKNRFLQLIKVSQWIA